MLDETTPKRDGGLDIQWLGLGLLLGLVVVFTPRPLLTLRVDSLLHDRLILSKSWLLHPRSSVNSLRLWLALRVDGRLRLLWVSVIDSRVHRRSSSVKCLTGGHIRPSGCRIAARIPVLNKPEDGGCKSKCKEHAKQNSS